MINPYPANVGEFLIRAANERWDLIRRLKG